MAKIISLSEETYARLQKLARPFVDREPEDVIRRLLDGASTKDVAKPSEGGDSARPTIHAASERTTDTAVVRAPRERGTIVELDGNRITATTVPDLCTKVLDFISAKGLWDQFVGLAPYATSAKRYLFAKSPKHPQGNDFFVPIKYKNIYMEAHKNYETTIKQLDRLLSQLGIDFKYVR